MDSKRLNELLAEKRMQKNTGGEPNYLRGLYALIDKYMGPDYTIVEIGSYEGASTELFAIKCKFVYSIDPYESGNIIKQEGLDNLLHAEKRFVERMKPYDNVSKIKALSDVAAEQFESQSVDAVYVDGDHRRESVIKDLKTWIPKIRSGGTISGHDYCGNVKFAIEEVVPHPEVFPDNSWAKRVD